MVARNAVVRERQAVVRSSPDRHRTTGRDERTATTAGFEDVERRQMRPYKRRSKHLGARGLIIDRIGVSAGPGEPSLDADVAGAKLRIRDEGDARARIKTESLPARPIEGMGCEIHREIVRIVERSQIPRPNAHRESVRNADTTGSRNFRLFHGALDPAADLDGLNPCPEEPGARLLEESFQETLHGRHRSHRSHPGEPTRAVVRGLIPRGCCVASSASGLEERRTVRLEGPPGTRCNGKRPKAGIYSGRADIVLRAYFRGGQ